MNGKRIAIVGIGVIALAAYGSYNRPKLDPPKAAAPPPATTIDTSFTPGQEKPPLTAAQAPVARTVKPEPAASKREIDPDTKAMYACKIVVERSAKYDFRWKNERWNPFPRSSVDAKGHVIFAGDDAEAQNGFGNWMRVNYWCKWDRQTMKIINVGIEPGRLR